MRTDERSGLIFSMRSFWDRIETSRLPRLRASEVLGAATVACLIFLLLLFRWLGA